jgi:putative SOS response-associated peptidase YedK
MCGRTGLFFKEIEFDKYNMAPTQTQPVLISSSTPDYPDIPGSTLVMKQWGIAKIINVRDDSSSFAHLRDTQRCIVPLSCFYEWHDKQPYCFLSDRVFYVGGLYRNHQFVIMTTRMVDSYHFVHDRMPVLLSKDEAMEWLSPVSFDRVQPLIRSVEKGFSVFTVSRFVNRVQNEGPECIVPVHVPRQRSVWTMFKKDPHKDISSREEKGERKEDSIQETRDTNTDIQETNKDSDIPTKEDTDIQEPKKDTKETIRVIKETKKDTKESIRVIKEHSIKKKSKPSPKTQKKQMLILDFFKKDR